MWKMTKFLVGRWYYCGYIASHFSKDHVTKKNISNVKHNGNSGFYFMTFISFK